MPRPGNMLFLVSYDLPSSQSGDRRRARLARYLQSVGIRVQWSVFELDIDPQKLGSVCLEIEEKIDPDKDSVRIYPICGTCSAKHIRMGKEAPLERSELMVW
jgi:CRISPR-associated protein Cas2